MMTRADDEGENDRDLLDTSNAVKIHSLLPLLSSLLSSSPSSSLISALLYSLSLLLLS